MLTVWSVDFSGSTADNKDEIPRFNSALIVGIIVVSVCQGAFLGRKVEEMHTLVVAESWPSVQLLDLLVLQYLEPFFVPVGHGRRISLG